LRLPAIHATHREWLTASAAAGWLKYETKTTRFTLPTEHAPCPADEDHPMFMGGSLGCVISMASVTPRILPCFLESCFGRFAGRFDRMERI
jgi:hypothetical protein